MAEQWKPILLVAILCARLTAGVMYVREYRSYSATVAVQERESAEDVIERLTDEEIEDVESAVTIYRELAEYQTYQGKSLV